MEMSYLNIRNVTMKNGFEQTKAKVYCAPITIPFIEYGPCEQMNSMTPLNRKVREMKLRYIYLSNLYMALCDVCGHCSNKELLPMHDECYSINEVIFICSSLTSLKVQICKHLKLCINPSVFLHR